MAPTGAGRHEALQLLFAREAHFHHVIIILQEALKLLAHCHHARVQPLVPRLHLPHPFQIGCAHLQPQAQALS